MRKNIKKTLTIGILISIVNSSIIPVFAADNVLSSNLSESTISFDNDKNNSNAAQNVTAKKVLKLDDAIEAAINNSDKLALKSKEIKMYEDKMDIQEKTNDLYETINQTVYDYPYDKLELQKKQTEQSKSFMEDQISSDITNKYNDMVLKEIDISKSKRSLELKKNDLDYLEEKLALGMATPNNLKDTQIEIKTLKDEITAKENTLNNNRDFFKVLTDLDLKNTYALDYNNIDYTKFKIDGSIDEYIDDKIDKYLKYDIEILKLTKDYMKDLKDDGIKDIMKEEIPKMPDKSSAMITNADGTSEFDTGSYAMKLIEYQQMQQEYLYKLNAYGEYTGGKYGVDEAQVKINDTRKNLKNALKESYSTLFDLENKIDTLKDQVNSTNIKLRFAKAQVDMGLMLQNDYDKQVIGSEELDTTVRKLVYTHNNLRDSIQKPWILSNQ
jgi:hypothetical protein